MIQRSSDQASETPDEEDPEDPDGEDPDGEDPDEEDPDGEGPDETREATLNSPAGRVQWHSGTHRNPPVATHHPRLHFYIAGKLKVGGAPPGLSREESRRHLSA